MSQYTADGILRVLFYLSTGFILNPIAWSAIGMGLAWEITQRSGVKNLSSLPHTPFTDFSFIASLKMTRNVHTTYPQESSTTIWISLR